MKRIFYLLPFFFITPCFSQYIVTKVVGNVKKRSTGEVVKPGDNLKKDEKLLYSSPNDIVRTIVAGSGVYIFNQPKEKEGNSLSEIVKFTLHIKSKEGNLSGRGVKFELLPEAFSTEASINTKNCISKENNYLFDKKIYDVSNGNKFFLQTEISGFDPVINSLQTKSDTLVLYRSDFKGGIKAYEGKVKYTLGFFSKNDNTSKALIQIKPYFDTTGEMQTILKIITSANKQSDKQKLQEQCYAEVYEALGKPSDIDFENAFDKIVNSKFKKSNKFIKNK